MGFPIGYTDFLIPNLFITILSLFSIFRKFITYVLQFVGLQDFLDPEMSFQPPRSSNPGPYSSSSATVIREFLPINVFSNVIDPPESCAVCLHEFEEDDEIRGLINCRHIFHRICLDRWIDQDQKTCPLCRMAFVPEHMQEMFNEKLWDVSGISDFYEDY